MTAERIRVNAPPVQVNKSPGDEILIAATIDPPPSNLPAVVYTSDGLHWHGADEQARQEGGTSTDTQPACWTGDRFLVALSSIVDTTHGTVLQSTDGKAWTWHPHAVFSTHDTTPTIYQLAADFQGQGVVAAAGFGFNGLYPEDNNNQLAISRDKGASWTVPTLPSGAYPYLVAVSGQTIVCAGSSAYSDESAFSLDGGFSWEQINFDVIEGISLYYILPIDGAWWFAISADEQREGVIFKTTDFRNWDRVHSPWDNDWPAIAVIPDHSNFSTATSMFRGGRDGRSVVVLGENGEGPNGQIMVTPDAGNTWKVVVDTSEAANWVGSRSAADIIAGFPPLSLDLYLGAAFAFDQWYITNFETPGAADTPAMLVASADFQTWKGIQLPSELQGDAYYYYMSGYGPVIAGG